MPKVWWAYLAVPSIGEHAVNALINIALEAGRLGYRRIMVPYMRTDVARNKVVDTFIKMAQDGEDTLVMLDCDHAHPMDILERLVKHDKGVIGALAYRRGEPYDPCALIRGADGDLHSIAVWDADADVIPVTVVGTGAIAIKRWVFDALREKGQEAPYFRYYYPHGTKKYPTEDVYFGLICDEAGIGHSVDVTLITPHLTVSTVDAESWQMWLTDHPESMTAIDDLMTQKAPPENGQPKQPTFVPAHIITRVDL